MGGSKHHHVRRMAAHELKQRAPLAVLRRLERRQRRRPLAQQPGDQEVRQRAAPVQVHKRGSRRLRAAPLRGGALAGAVAVDDSHDADALLLLVLRRRRRQLRHVRPCSGQRPKAVLRRRADSLAASSGQEGHQLAAEDRKQVLQVGLTDRRTGGQRQGRCARLGGGGRSWRQPAFGVAPFSAPRTARRSTPPPPRTGRCPCPGSTAAAAPAAPRWPPGPGLSPRI